LASNLSKLHFSLFSIIYKKVGYIATSILMLCLLGCANIVPPEGGKIDNTPPVLLAMTPSDSSLNTKVSKIEMQFNKFMEVKELEKNMHISPLLAYNPTVESFGKRVVIKIADSLLTENTTYKLSLGNSLVDNREATPYADFDFTFSTGSYFDSLGLHGNVIDAATGMPDTAALVVLYQANEIDSAVVKKKPFYAARTNTSGSFSFTSLPQKPFHIYAIQDVNNNFLYDYGEEKIGFLEQMVTPVFESDSSFTFYMFKDSVVVNNNDSLSNDTTEVTPAADKFAKKSLKPKPSTRGKNNIGYQVNVDTLNRDNRTFELTKPLTIDLHTEILSLDTQKVYLSYENGGIEVEAVQQLKMDSGTININTQWQADKLYTLRLVKGWAKDTANNELPPGKYFFRTKREEDYATLKLKISNQYYGDQYVLYVYTAEDSIYQKPITDSLITLPLMKPGTYSMRIIQDDNRNGKWDAGNFFAKKQPESVIPYSSEIILKAGWENEIDFLPPSKSTKPKAGLGAKGNFKDAADKKEEE